MALKNSRFSILMLFSVIGVLAIALAAWRAGYQSGMEHSGAGDLIDAKVVSLDELDTISSGRSIFYQGSNDSFHYVRVDGVGYFRLRSSNVTIPQQGFQGDGASSLGMIWRMLTIEDGKLKASDPPTGSF